MVGERDGEGAAAGRRFPQTGEEAADREGGRQRRGPGALLSFPLGVFFLIFFLPFNPAKQTMLHSRGKRLFHFKITRAKSQSLKRRGKITITL